jgi:hypothetical protein
MAKSIYTKNKVTIADNTVLCVGDSCTTNWKGNGEMRVLGFYWDYDHPIKVIRLSDSAKFCMQPKDLVSYTE